LGVKIGTFGGFDGGVGGLEDLVVVVNRGCAEQLGERCREF